jgi:hypothetical protein
VEVFVEGKISRQFRQLKFSIYLILLFYFIYPKNFFGVKTAQCSTLKDWTARQPCPN